MINKRDEKFKEFLKQFKPKKIHFEISAFEELMLNDIYQSDEQTKIKLNRNVTDMFNKELNMYHKQKRNIRYSLKGETRSHVGSDRVLLSNLNTIRMDNIKNNDEVISYNKTSKKFEKKKVREVFLNGKKQIYELKLTNGRKNYISKNHKFLVKKLIKRVKKKKIFSSPEWRELKDIDKSYFVACPKILNFEEKTKYDLNEIKLLGFWLSDGYMKNNHSRNGKNVQFDLSKQSKINFLLNIVASTERNYKINRTTYKRKNINWKNGNKFSFSKLEYTGLREKDYFTQMIYDLNLSDCLCYEKYIPSIIKNSTKKEIWAILNGLFNGDSWVDKTKGLTYNTTSKKLWEDIQILLLKVGLHFTINEKKPRKESHRVSYEIKFSQNRDLMQILDNCDLLKNNVDKLIFFMNSKTKNKSYKNYCVDCDVVYYPIRSITKKDIEQTYDFEVADNNNYIANLIISHNSGKSYAGLKIAEIILSKNGIDFNEKIDYYVCGNQIEYRQKLKKAKFGEFYLIDENYFTRAGLGSNIEYSQLMDYNNIIAKKNIGNIFITPEKFLNVGSVLGFSTYGRDNKNWLSRLLLFKFKDTFQHLIGYVIIDIGDLYRKYGCFVYREIGGCTNNERYNFKDINQETIKYSSCIPEKYKKANALKSKLPLDEDNKINNCPFYNVCTHGMCKYEHKKDSWIDKELKGGLDERTYERFKLSLKLILDLQPEILSDNQLLIKLNAKNGKDLKNRIKLKVHKFTNTKFGIAEFDELVEIVKSNTDINFLIDTLQQVKSDKLKESFFNLENSETLKRLYNDLTLSHKNKDKWKDI